MNKHKMTDHIYSNTAPLSKERPEATFECNRSSISIRVLLTVLLFLSLLANGVLSYLLSSSGTDQLMGCGTETNFSKSGG
ncbi:hypothetical protein PO909_001372 [Leuciscus waleckii]